MSHKQKKVQKILENKSKQQERKKKSQHDMVEKPSIQKKQHTQPPQAHSSQLSGAPAFKKYNEKQLDDDLFSAYRVDANEKHRTK
jgi:hypothetical protein